MSDAEFWALPPRSTRPGGALVAAYLLLGAALIGGGVALGAEHFEFSRTVRAIPPATELSPEPRIYAGKLHGPATRTTPTGKRAALTVTRVISTRKGSALLCDVRLLTEVVLEHPTLGTLAVPFDESTTLVSDDLDGRASDPRLLDLGSYTSETIANAPPHCAGSNRETKLDYIPDGADVEVLACADGPILKECPAAVRRIVAAPTMRKVLEHAERSALGPLRITSMLAAILSLVVSVYLVVLRGRVTDVLMAVRGGPGRDGAPPAGSPSERSGS